MFSAACAHDVCTLALNTMLSSGSPSWTGQAHINDSPLVNLDKDCTVVKTLHGTLFLHGLYNHLRVSRMATHLRGVDYLLTLEVITMET